jgi:uncharacterized protein
MTGKKLESFAAKYGPWAIIAGVSEGLGESYATALAQKGLNLALVGRRIDFLQQLSDHLTATCEVKIRLLPLDLSVPACLVALKESTRDIEVGFLGYIACAALKEPFLDCPEPELLEVIKENWIGPSVLISHFGKKMRGRGKGGIIIAGSNAFDLSLVEGLWDQFRKCGIDLLCCIPGAGLESEVVVRESLNKLGKTFIMIPGRVNRFYGFMHRHLLSPKKAARLAGNSVKKISN